MGAGPQRRALTDSERMVIDRMVVEACTWDVPVRFRAIVTYVHDNKTLGNVAIEGNVTDYYRWCDQAVQRLKRAGKIRQGERRGTWTLANGPAEP